MIAQAKHAAVLVNPAHLPGMQACSNVKFVLLASDVQLVKSWHATKKVSVKDYSVTQ